MSEEKQKEKKRIKFQNKNSNKGSKVKWITLIVILTFIISSTISYVSDLFINRVDIFIAFIILIGIILLGILFDVVGMAVTAADETPFHSMASRKTKGARTAVMLIRNADKVATFCNDVIGDIAGVISGTTGAVIVAKILAAGFMPGKATLLALVMSGCVASLTVGGKALGKFFAISRSNNIVYNVAWIIESFRRKNKLK